MEFNTLERNWTNLPLHRVLYEWFLKNVAFPSEMSTIVVYLALFLITWYLIVRVTRFIISIIWPLFLIASAIVIYRFLQSYEPEELKYIFLKALTMVVDNLVLIFGRLVEYVAKLVI